MSGIKGLLLRTQRPTQIIVPWYRRFTLIPHVIIGLSVFIGAFFDRSNFSSPVFKTIFQWADLSVWAVFFLGSAVASFIAILNNSWKMYFAGNIGTLALSLLWGTALLDARFRLDFDVSSTAFGLWGFVISTCIVLAAIPIKVIRTR